VVASATFLKSVAIEREGKLKSCPRLLHNAELSDAILKWITDISIKAQDVEVLIPSQSAILDVEKRF
jgi:hypothetical protein